jgi:hypothetical protein
MTATLGSDELVTRQKAENWGPDWKSIPAGIEMRVIDAIGEVSERPCGSRYDKASKSVVVTVFTMGDVLSAEEEAAIQRAAESVSEGIPVIVEESDEDLPVEATLAPE